MSVAPELGRTLKKTSHVVFLMFFLWSAPFLASANAGDAKDGSEAEKHIQQLEKRISDLESAIKVLMGGKKARSAEEEGKAESGNLGTSGAPKVPKSGEKDSADADGWEEPDVQKDVAKGRDEDARRRLVELETWKRKAEARAAKEAEEVADKVRFDFSGKYKLRYNITNNLNLDNPFQVWRFDKYAYFDQRFQLKIEPSYGPLSLTFLLDKGNFAFDWKEGSEGTLERWTGFQPVSAALVRELNFQYTGGFIVKVGRQNLSLGNGGIVLEGPMDSLKLVAPLGKTPIGSVSATIAYLYVSGGYKNYSNIAFPPGTGDRSTAFFGMDNKLDAALASFDIKPGKYLTIQPYALKVIDRGDFGDPDLNLDKDYNASTTPRDRSFVPLWVGAAVSGKSDGLAYTGDIVYLTGSYSRERNFQAYALMLRGDYNFQRIGPLFNFSPGLEFGRGSGNTADEKISGTGDVKDFTALFLCRDRRKYGNIFSEDLRAGFFLADSNLANVTFVRGIMSFEPIKNFRSELALAKLWTTEAVFKGHGPVGDWSLGTSASTEKTREIGWEVDWNLDFPIVKRLRGFVEAGYFIPGDVYQLPSGEGAGDAYKIVFGSEFEF